jgi:hypothetical protein
MNKYFSAHARDEDFIKNSFSGNHKRRCYLEDLGINERNHNKGKFEVD